MPDGGPEGVPLRGGACGSACRKVTATAVDRMATQVAQIRVILTFQRSLLRRLVFLDLRCPSAGQPNRPARRAPQGRFRGGILPRTPELVKAKKIAPLCRSAIAVKPRKRRDFRPIRHASDAAAWRQAKPAQCCFSKCAFCFPAL